MSVLSYNGITLPYANSTDFRQEAVYDPRGHTDRILMKIVLTVQSMVNVNYLADLAPGLLDKNKNPTTNNPADIIDFIRTSLLKPRQSLSYSFDGRELIPVRVQGNKGNIDAKNGPKPLALHCQQLTNTTFLITYAIEAHYWENNQFKDGQVSANLSSNIVLYNRWRETVEIDVDLMSTYTREGSYAIRSDNNQGKTANAVLTQMIPGAVREGFIRKQETFTLSDDGLTMDYKIVEEEKFRMPPEFATQAHGWYKLHLQSFGCFATYEVYCDLKGPKINFQSSRVANPKAAAQANKSPQDLLIQAAIYECMARFNLNGVFILPQKIDDYKDAKTTPPNAVISQMDITADMYDNHVQVHIIAIQQKDIPNNFGIDTARLGNATTGSKRPINPINLRGSARLQLQAAAYYDPNNTEQKSLDNLAFVTDAGDKDTITEQKTNQYQAANFNPGRLPGQEGKKGPIK